MNLKHILWTALTITMLLLTAAFLRPGTSVVMAQADKVAICHFTGSETNPFNFIVVSEEAAKAHIGPGGHSRDRLASEEEIKKEKCEVTTTTCEVDDDGAGDPAASITTRTGRRPLRLRQHGTRRS